VHAVAANAVRAVACLPALVGAWRQAAGGFPAVHQRLVPEDRVALERPELLAGRTPRTVNMSVIGDDLAEPERLRRCPAGRGA
jgi:anaerobic selenocysteine-containing dehydrogenase